MNQEQFLKGIQLFALARTKAQDLDIDPRNMKMEPLIQAVQEREGNEVCFRRKETCSQLTCCWQLSCGAEMKD